jgi:predicted nucleic acid-binding protein
VIVVVDTSVWSLAFRRRSHVVLPPSQAKHVRVLKDLIADARVALLGMVRQEILSGIKGAEQFVRLRDYLQGFPDVPLETSDYEDAAEMWNTCRSHGIAGNPIDLLICSVASRRQWIIYTIDLDFERYAKHLPVKLLR